MNTIKGFISNPTLADNTAGQVALFGELSAYANTFSRTRQQYANNTIASGLELITFTSKNDLGVTITLSVGVRNHILEVCNWVYGQYGASAIPPNSSKLAFINALTTQFPTMSAVGINEILNGSPSTKRLPDQIYWHFDDGGTDTQIRIWFADSRFRTQYDDYEILVIPPLTPIDDLNNPLTTVNLLLNNVTTTQIINQANTLASGIPYTTLHTFDVIWNDLTVPNATLTTRWSLVIYGAAGLDNDAIKSAIREYISDNSTLTVWSSIYPSLYAENEFCIIPMWSDIASPQNGLDPTLYRSAVRAGKLITVSSSLVPNTYSQSVSIVSFMNSNLFVGTAVYRSLAFTVIGNPNNVGGQYNFGTKYPDYMAIPTTHADFARMSTITQNFVIKLNDALDKARDLTSISSVPVGYTRAIRNGKVYLSFDYLGITYLVLASASYSE